MDKRLLLALAISMVILFGWWKLFPPQQTGQAPAPTATQTTPSAPAAPAPAATAPPATGAPSATPSATPGSAPSAAPATRPAEERVVLESPDATFVLSSWGGTLRELRLKEEKFLERKGDPTSGLQIISTTTPEMAPLRTTFPRADFSLPETIGWAVSRPAADSVVFRADTDAVSVEKRYKTGPGRYQLQLEIVVQNKTDKPQNEHLALHLFARQDPKKAGGGMLDYASANITEMVCYVNDKAERNKIEDLISEPKDHNGTVRWVAADEKFITLAAVPHPDEATVKCGKRGHEGLIGEVFVTYAPRTIPPAGSASYAVTVFGGPKYTEALSAVRPAGQDVALDKVVDVTFAVFSKPLLFLLKTFQRFANNWGLAIILLTLFVKMLTFYPTQKTMLSAKKMQKLAPKMAALRKKYENDRQRLGIETMNMYKANGVSPLGGCLPTLIQMPIWIALFSTLNYAVELHRSSFLYIVDLSAKDPYYITPLLMGGVMFMQMRMSPAGTDPQQQKMMAIMMPIMFTGFSLFLPAGLAIYTLTSYLIGIGQQLYVNYLDRKGDRKTGGAAPAPAKG